MCPLFVLWILRETEAGNDVRTVGEPPVRTSIDDLCGRYCLATSTAPPATTRMTAPMIMAQMIGAKETSWIVS